MTRVPSISKTALLSMVRLAPDWMVSVAPSGMTSFPLMVTSDPLIRVQDLLTVTMFLAVKTVVPASEIPPTVTSDISESSALLVICPFPELVMLASAMFAPVPVTI